MSLRLAVSRRSDWVRGTALGALTFVAVFLAVPPFAGNRVEAELSIWLYTRVTTDLSASFVDAVLVANAHYVPLPWGSSSLNALLAFGGTRAVLVPVVLLALGGFLAARGAPDARSGIVRGATLVVGYVPVAVLAMYVFQLDAGEYTLRPNLLLFGAQTAAHAVIFGGAGGLVAYALEADAARPLQDALDDVPLRTGALAGAGAYVAAYVVSYVLGTVITIPGTDRALAPTFSESVPWLDGTWQAVGALFYNAQFVPLTWFTRTEQSGNFLTNMWLMHGTSNVEPLFVVPIAVLLVTGYLVGRRTGGGVAAGASLVVGYGALAVAGFVVFAGTTPSGTTAQPHPAMTALRAGLVYPLLVGGLGGWLADR